MVQIRILLVQSLKLVVDGLQRAKDCVVLSLLPQKGVHCFRCNLGSADGLTKASDQREHCIWKGQALYRV